MNPKRKKRMIIVLSLVITLGGAIGLVLYALQQNINLFYTPTELLAAKVDPGRVVRIGGYVQQHSLHFDNTGKQVNFVVTDRVHNLTVNYEGLLPNLFREGQGVVITGKLNSAKVFVANEVLAKHDEKYMPKAVADALKRKKVIT